MLANPNNAQYVVQPFSKDGNITTFLMPPVPSSTHQFVWREDSIVFTSWRGLEEHADSVIQTWTYTGSDIPPPGGERMHFNLWLFEGTPPSSGEFVKVVIKSFRYRS